MWPYSRWHSASASSASMRSSGRSPMPTRMPLVNGICSSPAARIVSSRSCRILRRRALVGDEVGARRLEHQPLRGRHLAQPREVGARQRAEVGVRQQAPLERLLATPHHVADEVLEAELREARPHARMVGRVVAGQDQQLLDVAPRRMVEQPRSPRRARAGAADGSRTRSTCSARRRSARATTSRCARR